VPEQNEVTQIEFVEAWQASSSTHEVAATLGLSRPAVISRARNLRGYGVKLKRFQPGRKKTDVTDLNRRIEEIGREQES
jgi:biotin operon repressor